MPSISIPPIMNGINTAVLTPLNKDLSVDLGRLYVHCLWLLENGCDGLGLLGSTGEANSFSTRERIDILEGLAKMGLPMNKTLPGTGSTAFTDTVDVTRCAMDVGVGGVLMLPPFYYKGVEDDGLYNAYAEIIRRVDAPQLRIYLYHIPSLAGVPITHSLIARLIGDFPDTVVGLKDSSGVLENMLSMIEKFPGFAIFPGADELFADVLQAGGAGCITANNNITALLMQKIYSNWNENGEIDSNANARVHEIRKIISRYPLVAALKAIMADHAGDDAWLNIRPPLTALNKVKSAKLISEIQNCDYEIPLIG